MNIMLIETLILFPVTYIYSFRPAGLETASASLSLSVDNVFDGNCRTSYRRSYNSCLWKDGPYYITPVTELKA